MQNKYPTGAEMIERTKTVKAQVENILRKYPQARGDYRILDWYFCREYTGVRLTFPKFAALRNCPSFETVHRRTRELMQEHPELQPTQRVRQKRMRREDAMRHELTGGLHLTDFINNDKEE